jgi:hypothetical protein
MLGWIILGAFIAWNVSLTVWLSILTADAESRYVELERRTEAKLTEAFVLIRELQIELSKVKE